MVVVLKRLEVRRNLGSIILADFAKDGGWFFDSAGKLYDIGSAEVLALRNIVKRALVNFGLLVVELLSWKFTLIQVQILDYTQQK
jgi:hypothetical protein